MWAGHNLAPAPAAQGHQGVGQPESSQLLRSILRALLSSPVGKARRAKLFSRAYFPPSSGLARLSACCSRPASVTPRAEKPLTELNAATHGRPAPASALPLPAGLPAPGNTCSGPGALLECSLGETSSTRPAECGRHRRHGVVGTATISSVQTRKAEVAGERTHPGQRASSELPGSRIPVLSHFTDPSDWGGGLLTSPSAFQGG